MEIEQKNYQVSEEKMSETGPVGEILKPEPIIVFFNGLGGAGKSEIVRYLKENPIDGWKIFDFDSDGESRCPKDGTEEEKHQWREKQMKWFLQKAQNNDTDNKNKTAIFGFSLYPSNTLELEEAKSYQDGNIHFALIDCEHEERKRRLIDRGTPDHWQGEKDWYPEFYKEMEKYSDRTFDNTSQPIQKTVEDIAEYLEEI